MGFIPIDPNKIKVGDPITKDLFDLIKSNSEDHELRINSLATSGGTVHVLNGDVDFSGFNISSPNIFYYKARQDFSINDFRAQLFTKDGVTSGTLTIDLQKATNTNDANFATILATKINFNFSSVSDYDEVSSLIDSGLNDVVVGDVLRVKILNIPIGFFGKILLTIGAQ